MSKRERAREVVANEKFFQRPQAAAVLKHGILSRYATVFSVMAGTRTGRVLFFDAYAGPGRYEDGSEGSPLRIMRTATRTAAWGRQVECIFTEADARHATNLTNMLRAEAPPDFKYTVLPGDASEHVDAALARAAQDAMLTFLDPFGTALEYDSLTSKLLARPSHLPTEVLLNLNLEMVSRIGGLLSSGRPQPHDEKTLGRLDAFFGDDWWRQVFLDARSDGGPGSAAAAATAVARHFVQRVKARTGYGYFGVPVRRRPSHSPLFLLVLFHRYAGAPWKFNEAVSLANAEWREFCWQQDMDLMLYDLAAEPGLFGENTAGRVQEQEHEGYKSRQKELAALWEVEIASNLLALATDEGPVLLGPHIGKVFGRTLGSARDMHVNHAWDALASRGMLRPRDKSMKRLDRAVLSQL